MDAQQLIQIIDKTGFPIVACCALFYLCNTTIKQKFYLCNTTIKQNTEVLKEVSNTLSLLVAHLENRKEA